MEHTGHRRIHANCHPHGFAVVASQPPAIRTMIRRRSGAIPFTLPDSAMHHLERMGLLAPETRESSFVLFELGGAWSHGRLTCPLLIRGATAADIPDPIKDLHPLSLEDGRQCQELLDEIKRATALNRKEGVGGAVEDKVRKLVEVAKTP